jgi:hypothetical protein
MADEPKPTSEWTRERPRANPPRGIDQEGYLDLLVSAYSVAQIASRPVGGAARCRSGLDEAAARCARGLARLQVARLAKAGRYVDVSLEEGHLEAIAPSVKVVRELNLHRGVHSARRDSLRGGLRAGDRRLRSRIRRASSLQNWSWTKKVARKSS